MIVPEPPAACEPVRAWRHGPAAYLQLNRPEKANAYCSATLAAMERIVDEVASDEEARVLIVCAAGERAFCAGADMNEMDGKDGRSALNLRSASLFDRLSRLDKVTLAAVSGAACGGGLELALACDLRMASPVARFSFPEPDLGLIPAAGGTQRLAQAVGRAKAKELILGGRVWDAEEAMRFGLVSEVCASEALLPRAQAWAERISRREPLALLLAKRAIDLDAPARAGFSFEAVAESLLYELRRKHHPSDCDSGNRSRGGNQGDRHVFSADG